MMTPSDKTNELKTVSLEKDTWILEVPAEVCRREGFAEGTLISLTLKDNGITASYIRPPSKKMQEIADRILEEDFALHEESNYHRLRRWLVFLRPRRCAATG